MAFGNIREFIKDNRIIAAFTVLVILVIMVIVGLSMDIVPLWTIAAVGSFMSLAYLFINALDIGSFSYKKIG